MNVGRCCLPPSMSPTCMYTQSRLHIYHPSLFPSTGEAHGAPGEPHYLCVSPPPLAGETPGAGQLCPGGEALLWLRPGPASTTLAQYSGGSPRPPAPCPPPPHTHREPGKVGLLTWKIGMQVRSCDWEGGTAHLEDGDAGAFV